jgi:hypothetical protein
VHTAASTCSLLSLRFQCQSSSESCTYWVLCWFTAGGMRQQEAEIGIKLHILLSRMSM